MAYSSGDEGMLSSKLEDYCIIKRNGNLYLVLSEQYSNNNIVNVVLYNNYFNKTSVLIPIIKRKYENAPVLNGKNWVKHYTIDKQEGFYIS
jgi:hypothetical protein